MHVPQCIQRHCTYKNSKLINRMNRRTAGMSSNQNENKSNIIWTDSEPFLFCVLPFFLLLSCRLGHLRSARVYLVTCLPPGDQPPFIISASCCVGCSTISLTASDQRALLWLLSVTIKPLVQLLSAAVTLNSAALSLPQWHCFLLSLTAFAKIVVFLPKCSKIWGFHPWMPTGRPPHYLWLAPENLFNS